MQTITSIKEMSLFSKRSKERGLKIALVPTMGNLHEGHLALVSAAKEKADIVVVSVFLNPIQFGPKEDFEQYPQDLNQDKQLLKPFEPVVLFAPKSIDMYPHSFKAQVDVLEFGSKLCGRFRPGHFKGVTTVVAKLFNIIKPDFAFFGEKDFQQQLIIKKMVRDLNYDIEIYTIPIVREYDGLAMSSRNSRLNPQERKTATAIYRALCQAKKMVDNGEKDSRKIIHAMARTISFEPSIRIEYSMIVNPNTLEEIKEISGKMLVVLAVHINKTRLIDNMMIDAG